MDAVPWLEHIGVPTLYLEETRDVLLSDDKREVLVSAPNVCTVTPDGPGRDLGYARPEI